MPIIGIIIKNMSELPLPHPFTPPTPPPIPPLLSSPEESSSFDIFTIFKIIFYLIFIIKIIQLSFLRRKKFSLKERIYRKFLFAHQELLRQFTDEDKSMMETTLTNTIKNASIDFDPKNSKIRKPSKRVVFQIERNCYYQPNKYSEKQQVLQTFKGVEQFLSNSSTTFEEKKIQEEFIQRQDLLGLDQDQNILPVESKLSAPEEVGELEMDSMIKN